MTVFETPATANYRVPLASALGAAPSPRLLVGPNPAGPIPGPATPLPNTTQQNKKSNVPIPYVRVVHRLDALDEQFTPVFVRTDAPEHTHARMHGHAPHVDRVAGLEAVNRELAAGVSPTAWRLDGILMNTEAEMDAPLGRAAIDDTDASLRHIALNVAVQGPCALRNDFCNLAQVGDTFYVGLADVPGEPPEWFCFAGSHLDAAHLPNYPRHADKKRRTRSHGFSRARLEHLNTVYKLGSVLDANLWPSRNGVQVNVDVRRLRPFQLGFRHDEDGVHLLGDGTPWYSGWIGSRVGALGGLGVHDPTPAWKRAFLALQARLRASAAGARLAAAMEAEFAAAPVAGPFVFPPTTAHAPAGALAAVLARRRQQLALQAGAGGLLRRDGELYADDAEAAAAFAAVDDADATAAVRRAAYAVADAALPLLALPRGASRPKEGDELALLDFAVEARDAFFAIEDATVYTHGLDAARIAPDYADDATRLAVEARLTTATVDAERRVGAAAALERAVLLLEFAADLASA